MNQFNRRDSLKSLAAFGAAGTLGMLSPLARAQKPITVGVIYVGPRDDYGYNQAHAQAAAELKKLPGVKLVEEENVPETVAVQKTMAGMIAQDGASLLFPTSFGYFDPHILAVAPKYPDVRFSHCGGLWTEKNPKNVGSFFGYIDECQYLNGVVAGHMTKSNKIAFVAAKPIPQVLRNINAFTMGARSVKPGITCHVIFTGDWSMAVKEAEATNSLADLGCDRMASGWENFCDTGGGETRSRHTQRSTQTGAAGTNDHNVVGMIDNFILLKFRCRHLVNLPMQSAELRSHR